MVMGINIGGKKSVKQMNSQLEGMMMVTNVNAGPAPEIKAQYSSPLTAIALAAGRLFRPTNKEVQAIDQQLSSILVESEGILKNNLQPVEKPADREPIILESVKVEKVQNYKDALPLVVETGPEMKEMIEDVKDFATKYKGNISFTSDAKAAEPMPADEMKASMDMMAEMRSRSGKILDTKPAPVAAAEPKDPLELDGELLEKLKKMESMEIKPVVEAKPAKKDPLAMDGDFMAKLKESAKMEQVSSSGPDIRRNMRDMHVTCDDLESDLAQISFIFKRASAKPKARIKR